MRRGGVSVVIIGAAVLVQSGCVVGRGYRDHPLDEQKIATIQRHVTTSVQILERFGPPQDLAIQEIPALGPVEALLNRREGSLGQGATGARAFRYSYSRSNMFVIFLVLFNYLDFDQKNDTLVIFFDKNEVVKDYAFVKDTKVLPRFGFWSR